MHIRWPRGWMKREGHVHRCQHAPQPSRRSMHRYTHGTASRRSTCIHHTCAFVEASWVVDVLEMNAAARTRRGGHASVYQRRKGFFSAFLWSRRTPHLSGTLVGRWMKFRYKHCVCGKCKIVSPWLFSQKLCQRKICWWASSVLQSSSTFHGLLRCTRENKKVHRQLPPAQSAEIFGIVCWIHEICTHALDFVVTRSDAEVTGARLFDRISWIKISRRLSQAHTAQLIWGFFTLRFLSTAESVAISVVGADRFAAKKNSPEPSFYSV